MDPNHARRLLRRMMADFGFDDLEYPIICELIVDGTKVDTSTIWDTDETGYCLVNAVVDGSLHDVSSANEVLISHNNARLRYFVTDAAVSEKFIPGSVRTRLSGFVRGAFGDLSDLVYSVTFVIPNMPNSLTHNRYIETFTSVDGEETYREKSSDFGAMSLKCDPWIVTLTRLGQSESLQYDYRGSIHTENQEERPFHEYRKILDEVSLFLSWICGSARYPAYVVGHGIIDEMPTTIKSGIINIFDTPGKPIGVSLQLPAFREIPNIFGQFHELMQEPEISICLSHAIRHYAEASSVRTNASRLAHTHAALTAIVRWDRKVFRGQIQFVNLLKETIVFNDLDQKWFQVATDIEKYRGNSLHVQPAWNYHDNPAETEVWYLAQQLVEKLLAVKLGLSI